MSNLLILSPVPIESGDLTASSAALNFPISHLHNPQPKIIWKAGSSGQVDIDIDLKTNTAFDTLFLGHTNADASATWEIRSATEAQGPAHLGNSASIHKSQSLLRASQNADGPRHHGFWTGSLTSRRYIRIRINQTSTPIEAGTLAIGQSFRPRYNYDWGSGRSLTDLSTTRTLRGGQMDVVQDAIIPNWRFVLGNLDDMELETLWKLTRKHGKSTPLLIVEDPDTPLDLQEAMHYGTFRDINAYERRNASKNRWEFTIQHWQ